MRWRRGHDAPRPKRPKTRRLTADEGARLLAAMTTEVGRSPVLRALDARVHTLRGRFYLDWPSNPHSAEADRVARGRITPLADADGNLLLEVEYRKGKWSEIARGGAKALIKKVAGDRRGSFHGLGVLDKSLRQAAKAGLERLPVNKVGTTKFVYADSQEVCTVQEALYHYFGLPVHVIAQPAKWYAYHRTPRIAECSADRTRVLVRFLASSFSGDSFGGTCLYLNYEGEWGAYTIRPNKSGEIATAEAWLIKRNWEPWD